MQKVQVHCRVRRSPPKSNLQRQREFVARNPHYYRDRTRRKKAERAAIAKLMAQHPEMTFGEAYNIATGKAPTPAQKQPATPPVVLALPAPEDVSNPTVTITLPEAFVYESVKLTTLKRPRKWPSPEPGVKPQATPPPGTPGRED